MENLKDLALSLGAKNAAFVKVSDLSFRREFRAACEQNTCGKYKTCWMCPPDVGDIDEMIARAKAYENALVFQTVNQLEDSFDIEGMEAAAKKHTTLTTAILKAVRPRLPGALILGAGACHVCKACARLEDKPCINPENAIASLEAYGIAVSELAALCGMNYINGPNTVTFFGGVLFS
ncbi:MAG: DUF2284 domain-containing protein [Oscillospiraceae bacterium]|nr:DUF2284 domain-containing protein [Oscillospiraceae bacterium]